MASDRILICIHGSGPKPAEAVLKQYWLDTIKQGLQRTHPDQIDDLLNCEYHFIHYAHHLSHLHTDYDEALDITQRQQVLEKLAELEKPKDFRRRYYDQLPGKSPLQEFAMDAAALLGLTGMVWRKVMPELDAYWQDDNGWATSVRQQLIDLLEDHLQQDHSICLVSHCLGSVISYDALRSLDTEKRVTTWLTLGAPLGDHNVKRKLLNNGKQSHLRSILSWRNISAEDDYVSHDKTIADDYQVMLKNRMVADISDHTIYNMSVRYGSSNPHHSAGYLTHPRVARFIGDWLGGSETNPDSAEEDLS